MPVVRGEMRKEDALNVLNEGRANLRVSQWFRLKEKVVDALLECSAEIECVSVCA
jgi:hypothetical protein